jgi:hypothetical protein
VVKPFEVKLPAAGQLAWLLLDTGEDEVGMAVLEALARKGDSEADELRAEHLRLRHDVQALRTLAKAGSHSAADTLAEILRDDGDLDGLRRLSDDGNRRASWLLLDVYRTQKQASEVLRVLRLLTAAGDVSAARQLALDLVSLDEAKEAEHAVRMIGQSHEPAGQDLVVLLAERENVSLLQVLAPTDAAARQALTYVLGCQGRLDDALDVMRDFAASRRWNERHAPFIDLLHRSDDTDRLAEAGELGFEYAYERPIHSYRRAQPSAVFEPDLDQRSSAWSRDVDFDDGPYSSPIAEVMEVAQWVLLTVGSGVIGNTAHEAVKSMLARARRRPTAASAPADAGAPHAEMDAVLLAWLAVESYCKRIDIPTPEFDRISYQTLFYSDGRWVVTIRDGGRSFLVRVPPRKKVNDPATVALYLSVDRTQRSRRT